MRENDKKVTKIYKNIRNERERMPKIPEEKGRRIRKSLLKMCFLRALKSKEKVEISC